MGVSSTSCRAAGSPQPTSTARGRSRRRSLPAGFVRIPTDSLCAFVLASVPGMLQGQEALIEVQIPQQGTLNRDTAKLSVAYGWANRSSRRIPGTPMSYAVNTLVQRDRDERRLLRVLPGRGAVHGRSTRRPVDTRRHGPAGDLHDPTLEPHVPRTYVRVYAATPQTVTYA